MKLTDYVFIWIILLLGLTWEYFAIQHMQSYSLFFKLKSLGYISEGINTSTDPGRPISYWLGVAGFSIMCITNLYVLRKRLPFMSKWGRLPGWMDFHIFCGLLGPTLIVFHSDFKVGGLVAISFWCMMISAGSGVIGRYFYIQVLSQKNVRNKKVQYWEKILNKYREKAKQEISDESFDRLKKHALSFAGVPYSEEEVTVMPIPHILFKSILGDVRLFFSNPKTLKALPSSSRAALGGYGYEMRRYYFWGRFQKLLGYWHAFHLPFAVFMYLTAIIHIAVALLFGVPA